MRVYCFLLINLLISSFAQAKTGCEKFAYKYQTYKGDVSAQDVFCFKKDFYFSKKCLDNSCIDLKKINKLKRIRKYHAGNYISRVGTREFKLCYEIGGRGQILSIKMNKKFVKTARCIIGEDFVEANYLEHLYLKSN